MEYTKDVVFNVHYGPGVLKENEKLSAFKRIRLLLNRHKMITAIVLITIMFMIFDFMLVSSFIEVLSSMNL